MKLLSFFCSFLLLIKASAAQDTFFYVDADSVYKITLPSSWNFQDMNGKTIKWKLAPEKSSSEKYPPSLQFEETEITPAFKTANLQTFAEEELRIIRQQFGSTVSVVYSNYSNINNKEWLRYELELAVTRKQIVKFLIQKTVHNGKAYALVFSSNKEQFSKYTDVALSYMNQIRFNKTDLTQYSNSSVVHPSALKTHLPAYSGTYTASNGNVKQTVVVEKSENDTYRLVEKREMVVTDKGVNYFYSFEATLAVEAINGDSVTLATDAVIKEDPFVNWTKGVYRLHRVQKGLTGVFYSKNNAFRSYDIVLNRLGVKASAQIVSNTGNDNSISTDTIGASNSKTYEPYGKPSSEKNYIASYGKNMVRRVSNHQLEFTLTTRRKVIISDRYNAKLKVHEEDGYFAGVHLPTNSFVIAFSESETGFKLVNRSSGNISKDYIPLEAAVYSPDGKWMMFDNTFEDESSAILLYSIGSSINKVYEKIIWDSNTGKGWYVDEKKWISNSVIELKKVVPSDNNPEDWEAAGTAWVNYSNGKWEIVNKKPITSNNGATLVQGYTTKPVDEKMPYNPPSNKMGGKDGNELGQIVFKAVKNNDYKLFHSLCLNGTEDEVKAALNDIREQLQMKGLADWSKTKFSRVTYSKANRRNDERIVYQFFNIEFSYGTEFIGYIRGYNNHGTFELLNGKYSLLEPLNQGVLLRK